MHATRARLPQKRTRSQKPAAKKSAAKKPRNAAALAAPDAAAALAGSPGVVNLAARRAERLARALPATEIFALVEWIAPARESWRRGELEIRRSACMPMTATLLPDGALSLTELPGQGDALRLESDALVALRAGERDALVLTLPGLRVTLTAEDLQPALPAPRPTATLLAFPRRSA